MVLLPSLIRVPEIVDYSDSSLFVAFPIFIGILIYLIMSIRSIIS